LTPATIRPGRDSDADGIIALIGACWAEYPGVVMDVDGEMPELRALATYYRGKGGALWVAEAAGRVVGMIAARPHGDGVWEICRVYVLPDLHGGGLGHGLLDTAEAHACSAGAARLELWSDTRFRRAHRFYEKRGYQQSGPMRALNDLSNSLEFYYVRSIDPISRRSAGEAPALALRPEGLPPT
jgi:GNAT superfamily N-acetyltransferase